MNESLNYYRRGDGYEYEIKSYAVRLGLHEQVRIAAAILDTTMGAVVTQALDVWFEKLNEESDDAWTAIMDRIMDDLQVEDPESIENSDITRLPKRHVFKGALGDLTLAASVFRAAVKVEGSDG